LLFPRYQQLAVGKH